MQLKFFRRHIVVLSLIVIIIIVVLFINMLWSFYISTTLNPFLNNEILWALPSENIEILRSRGWETHVFRDFSGSGYVYQVMIPPWLNFGGGISIITPTDLETSQYYIGLTVFTGFGEWVYSLGLGDLTTDNTGENINALASAVDRNGQPLERHPADSEEFYEQWLAMHEKFYDPIMQLFANIKYLFGEDAFR